MIKIAGKKLNRKGYTALTLLITLIVGITLTVNFVKASNIQPEENIQTPVKIEVNILDEDLKEIDVVVRKGDTAWNIQKELTPDKDIYEVISQLEKLNDVNLKDIKSGDVIKFAIKK